VMLELRTSTVLSLVFHHQSHEDLYYLRQSVRAPCLRLVNYLAPKSQNSFGVYDGRLCNRSSTTVVHCSVEDMYARLAYHTNTSTG
jgi:hypothetical protein